MNKGLLINILCFLSISAYSQSVVDARSADISYRYDASMFLAFHEVNNIKVSDSDLQKMRYTLDSLAKTLLLTNKDEITVYKSIAMIKKNALIGFADFKGNIIIEPKFSSAHAVRNTHNWIVEENNKWGLINPVSKQIYLIKTKYATMSSWGSLGYGDGEVNRFKVSYNDLIGVVDSIDNVVIPLEYSLLDGSQADMYLATKNGKSGFIDSLNNVLIEFKFDACGGFYNNLLAPAKVGKWGLINKSGRFVVKPEYDDMFTFQNGILRVSKNGKTGFLNEKGKVFIPLKYDDADAYYRDDVLRVQLNNKYAFLDKKGRELCEFKYDVIGKFRYGCALVKVGKLIGVVNTEGREIIPVKHQKIDLMPTAIIVNDGPDVQYYTYEGIQIDPYTGQPIQKSK